MSMKFKPVQSVECTYDQLFNDGKYEEAILIMEQFIKDIEDNPYGQMLAYINIASCYYNLTKTEEAFQYILRYKDLCTAFGDEMDHYALYHLYSLIYCQEQNFTKALEAANKCLEIANSLQLQKELAESYNLLSFILIFTNSYEKALQYAKQAQIIAYQHCQDNLYLICEIHCNLASVYTHLNQIVEAENTLLLLEANPYIISHSRERSRFFYLKGLLRLKSGHLDAAINAFEEAKQIAYTVKDNTILKYILKQLAFTFEQTNNLHYAYLYLKQYVTLVDEMHRMSSTSKISQLDTNHSVASITQRANVDPLSNVYNRYILESTCDNWLKDARKTKDRICCLAFDVDNFKHINDHFGHLMGDEVIKAIGQACNEHIQGEHALASRYGGDEFVILLKNYSDRDVMKTARTLFNTITNMVVNYDNQSVQITISMGIVCNHSIIARKFTQLFKVADQALYMAKSQGKNQIVTLSNTNCHL